MAVTPKAFGHGDLLPLGIYEVFEAGHPGYLANVETIRSGLQSLKAHRKDRSTPFAVLEMGAGPGTLLTKMLGETFAAHGDTVLVNEIEETATGVLRERQKQGILNGNLQIQPAGDILEWMEDAKQKGLKLDAVVSNFTAHHLQPHQLDKFFELANDILKPGGRIITGEEHLDFSPVPEMMKTLGLSDEQTRRFTKMAASADRIVTNYEEVTPSLRQAYEQERKQAAEALKTLGIPEDVSPLELRKYLRPASMIAYHVGRIIDESWNEGKIKLPALEFKAMASGLATCDTFFDSMHGETGNQCAPGEYNKVAVPLLEKLTDVMRDRMARPFVNWESIEPGATQEGRVDATASRHEMLHALDELRASLGKSTVVGAANPCTIYDPDIRFEDGVRKGSGNIEIYGIDYKVTPMQFAEAGAKQGFRVGLKMTGGHAPGIREAYQLSREEGGDIHIGGMVPGTVGVSFACRANEYKVEPQRGA